MTDSTHAQARGRWSVVGGSAVLGVGALVAATALTTATLNDRPAEAGLLDLQSSQTDIAAMSAVDDSADSASSPGTGNSADSPGDSPDQPGDSPDSAASASSPDASDDDGPARPTTRLSGADRFATSVEISRHQYAGGATVVYLARSDGFADALAGGVLSNGPILLVPSCGPVPSTVLGEIDRLNPQQVVALGGTTAICDQVLDDASRA